MKFKLIILTILVFCWAHLDSTPGQNAVDKPYIIPSDSSGEIHSAMSDAMRVEAQQSGERLFVIVRLGKGETSRRVSIARLRAVKNYFTRGGFDSQPIIFAEGEPVAGEGQFEYYLGSKLQFIALAPKNKIPNFTCCEDYFPPVKRKPKRKSKK